MPAAQLLTPDPCPLIPDPWRDTAQDDRVTRAGGRGQVARPAVPRLVGQHCKRDGLLCLDGQAQLGAGEHAGRGQGRVQLRHQGWVVRAAAADDDFIGEARQKVTIGLGDRTRGERGERRGDVGGRQAGGCGARPDAGAVLRAE